MARGGEVNSELCLEGPGAEFLISFRSSPPPPPPRPPALLNRLALTCCTVYTPHLNITLYFTLSHIFVNNSTDWANLLQLKIRSIIFTKYSIF